MRTLVLRWIASHVRNRATAEDLTQEAVLRLIVAAQREGISDPDRIAQLAHGIARNLVANHWRRSVRNPESAGLLEDLACLDAPSLSRTRDDLLALRPELDPLLSNAQRALLAAWIDEDITTVRGLAARLQTSPANVRRRLITLAKKIARHFPRS